MSPAMPPGCAQCERRVCTGYPQGHAHHELAVGAGSGKLSGAWDTKDLASRTQSRMMSSAGGGGAGGAAPRPRRGAGDSGGPRPRTSTPSAARAAGRPRPRAAAPTPPRGAGDAEDLVAQAKAEVYAVTDRRVSEDYLPLSEIMPGTLDEIEAIGSRSGGMTGVPTGFADLDALTNGLHPGQMIVIAARPALGKALALCTPLPTPTGWTTMGEARVGDYLIGADGKPTRVLAATHVLNDRPCFEVEFVDGTVIVAHAAHH